MSERERLQGDLEMIRASYRAGRPVEAQEYERNLVDAVSRLREERDEAEDYAARAAEGNIDRARMPLPARVWLDAVAERDRLRDALREAVELLTEVALFYPPDASSNAMTLRNRTRAFLVLAASPVSSSTGKDETG